MNTYYIYALIDGNGDPFYIGKTNNLQRRKARHLAEARNGSKYYVYNKIRKLLRDGQAIDILIIESNLSADSVDSREQFHIADFRSRGFHLCNLAIGGEGGRGMTPEMHRRAAEKRRGRKLSETTRKRISESKTGLKFSLEHRKALSSAWTRTSEQLAKVAEKNKAQKGKINTKQYRLLSPDGTEYVTDRGLTVFCEEHGLTRANLLHVCSGKRAHHRGWKIERLD